jgi:hypothetical protein
MMLGSASSRNQRLKGKVTPRQPPTTSMEAHTMTDRFDTLTDVAQQPYDTFDGAQPASTAIDDLIAHIRAAHDAGTTIGELHARLAPLLSGTPTGATPSKPSSMPNAVPFPLPAPFALQKSPLK